MRHSVATVLQTVSRVRTGSIRNQILVFAVLATLVPSAITAIIAYTQNRRALTEKITQQLSTASGQAAREADVWLKERMSELRTFASSYEVSENLVRGAGRAERLGDYLTSVQTRFGDYGELQALDAEGRRRASSLGTPQTIRLPSDWVNRLRTSSGFVDEPFWDPGTKQTVVTLGVQVDRPDGRLAGALVGRTHLKGIGDQLFRFAEQTSGRVLLVTAEGRLIADSRTGPALESPVTLDAAALTRLKAGGGGVTPFPGVDGTAMVGSARSVGGRATWLAIAELPEAEAYRQVTRLRNVALLVGTIMLAVIGLIAYRLGALIARPLDRLTAAAAKVTAGDLTVGLPEAGGGEVGYLTQVFNDMVTSLRTHQAELERLSTTDSLTGLVNRRHLIATLGEEAQRARRYNRGFAVLMVDVDHFKAYNDTFGHPAGDEVLRQVGAVLRECTRTNDCAARYGGEEFLVMLSETPLDGAQQVAERIRSRMSQVGFDGKKVTLSIGLALFPGDGDTPDAVISAADGALYEAKRAGRNRIMLVGQKAPSRGSKVDGVGKVDGAAKTDGAANLEVKPPEKEKASRTLTGKEKKKR